jgi:hypothetical protein
MSEYKTFNVGNNIICTTYCNYRLAVTLYTLETWFLFRYVIVNTVHKGDK